ncbi:transcriptional regulator [Sediminicoccus sp. KRV36]|uniref:winged helix-turn-helix domain-containing protein n=1 Tax=Sediminicoccus sp. KRV36 TaxID=3133721 RepID=UPI00200E5C37|nr:transcriptional regulator [Sediminicoccus rosea]UPY35850.1 transcriptional regulator [Sediminicoccus rosea]
MSDAATRRRMLAKSLSFDGFTLDTARGALSTGDREVVLRPKTAAVLAHLLLHAGEVVSREALLDAVWPDVAVTDDSVTQCVSEIRRALGEAAPRLLQTLPRRGYLLATELRPEAPPAASAPNMAPRRRAALALAAGLPVLAAAYWLWPALPQPAQLPAASPRAMAETLLEQGRARLRGGGSFEVRLRESLPFFREASALDPSLAQAAAEATFTYANLITARHSEDPAADLAEARRYAELAHAAAPQDPFTLHARAVVLRHEGRYAEALPLFRQAGEDPSRITARAGAGLMLLLLGQAREAIAPLEAMLVEAPFHPFAGTWRTYLGIAKLFAGEADHGAEDFALPPSLRAFMPQEERLLYRLAALAQTGRAAEAAALHTHLRARAPDLLARTLAAPALSHETAYLALREARFVVPLLAMGWAIRME